MRKFVFAILPVAMLLMAAEGWYRLQPPRDEYRTNSGVVEPSASRIWKLRAITAGPLATNSLGLRDGPYRSEARFKILVLGDSVSWGNGIDDTGALFASRLERALNKAGRGLDHEVINSGVPGYSTFQELDYLKSEGLALDPDLVILQFCLNDVVERYRALAGFGGNRHFLGIDTRQAVRGIYGFALRHSYAFEAAARGVQRWLRNGEEFVARSLASDELSDGLESAWSRVEMELDGVAATAQAAGVPLILLTPPYRFQLADPAGLRQPQERLGRWAASHRVPHVDLLAYMALLPADAVAAMFSDESHLSESGHALAAQLLLLPVKRALADQYARLLG